MNNNNNNINIVSGSVKVTQNGDKLTVNGKEVVIPEHLLDKRLAIINQKVYIGQYQYHETKNSFEKIVIPSFWAMVTEGFSTMFKSFGR